MTKVPTSGRSTFSTPEDKFTSASSMRGSFSTSSSKRSQRDSRVSWQRKSKLGGLEEQKVLGTDKLKGLEIEHKVLRLDKLPGQRFLTDDKLGRLLLIEKRGTAEEDLVLRSLETLDTLDHMFKQMIKDVFHMFKES